jgi:osmotically-inducible protein OsmY
MDTGRNCNGKKRTTSAALAAALASVVAVLGGAGCGTTPPLNARYAPEDTAAIQEALQTKLARDGRLSTLTSVKVNPANGIVTLSGQVATDADREAAGKLASSIKGVAMIYNEIQVERPGP